MADPSLTRQFSQMREIRAGRQVFGWNAHEAFDPKAVLGPTAADKRHRLSGRDTALLRLLADIDLHIDRQWPLCPTHFDAQRYRQLFPIEAFDAVEQRDGIAHLVGLQWPDEVQFDVGELSLQGRPLFLRFLDPVFSEETLPCRKDWSDAVDRHRL